MQDLALHIEHFKISDVEGICKENTRTAEHYRNKVDFSLSSGNYLAYSGEHVDRKNYTRMIKDILQNTCCHYEKRGARGGRGGRPRSVLVYNDTGKAIRKDANYMSSVVVTISRDTAAEWGEGRVKEYFRCCSYFLEKRYGSKLDDVVHVDERAAGIHMHYNFIPLLNGRLNSDKLFTRATLAALHTEFTEFLQEKGFDVVRGIEGGKKEYYRTIAELKKKQAKLASLTDEKGRKLSDICNEAEFLKASSSFFGFGKEKPDRYVFNAEDAETLVNMANAGVAAAEVLAGYKANNEAVAVLQEDNKKLRAKNDKLSTELQAEREHSMAMAAEAAEQARAEVLEQNKHLIHNGKFLAPIAPYKDIVDKVTELVAEARKRTKERKIQENKARQLARKRVHTQSRDDDYSL